MARLNTKLTLDAPDEISVPLVRADVLDTSNTFRLCFEIFLAITSALIGVVLSIDNAEIIHFIFLTVSLFSCIAFFIKSQTCLKKGK